MAENNDNKVVIVFDVDGNQYTAKLNDLEGKTRQSSSVMGTALKDVGLSVVGINQALELASKGFELFNKGVEVLAETERKVNQMSALKSMAASVGVDSDKLVESIKKATGGTITTVDATNIAIKSLKSGITADMIPKLVELGDKFEKVSGGAQTLTQFMDATANSIQRGAIKGMADFGIVAETTGNRQAVLNSILKQGSEYSKSFGNSFSEIAERIETRAKESKSAFSKWIGSMVGEIGFEVYATDAEKAEVKVKKLEASLKEVTSAMAAGRKVWSVGQGEATEVVDIEEARLDITKRLASAQADLNKHKETENKETEALNAGLQQTGAIVKSLTEEEKKRADLISKRAALEMRAAQEERDFGMVSVKTQQDLMTSKKAIYDNDYQNKRMLAISSATNEADLVKNLTRLEQERYDESRKLRADDETWKQILRQSEYAAIEKHYQDIENVIQRQKTAELSIEQEKFNAEMERLRMSGLAKDEMLRQAEQNQIAHEQRMNQIKDSYMILSSRNVKLGLSEGMNDLKKQFGDVSKIAKDSIGKTHGMISSSIVNAAKTHGDAMEAMKNQFLEYAGTQLVNSGTYHMMEGAAKMFGGFPGGAGEMGQGLAMIAAGSALVGASAPAASSAGGGGDSGTSPGAAKAEPQVAQKEQLERKQASIVINGDYLNSRETANHLAEVLRQNSDITDYTITAQGRSYY